MRETARPQRAWARAGWQDEAQPPREAQTSDWLGISPPFLSEKVRISHL